MKYYLYKMDSDKKIFYVCTYGGSGSKALCNALEEYGTAYHIHSRVPPECLEYIANQEGGDAYYEWFNGIPIPDEKLKEYTVIYIYRDPSFAIPSRFENPKHLENIQTDKNIKLEDIYKTGQDLYKIREFHDNYIKHNIKRNYKIYCVKYEEIFDKQEELSKLLGIGKLNLVDKSQRKTSHEKLKKIYADLITEMKENDFIIIN